MADLPRVTDNDFVERAGVITVAKMVNDARCVWREMPLKDIGIDGHIEYITPEGFAPGRLVAVQVKAGASWFQGATSASVPFVPVDKHRRYWSAYPLPVILVLHHPDTGETIWADARAQLRISESATLQIPRHTGFDEAGVLACLACDGPLPSGGFDAWTVVRAMSQSDDRAQGLSFLHVFAQGMTDICNSVYFSMDVVSETLDALAADHQQAMFGVGEIEYQFVDRYVDSLIAHDLARVDYSGWKQALVEREMVGRFFAPLTARGRLVRDLLIQIDAAVEADPDPQAVVIRERFVQMLYNPAGYDEFGSRHRRISTVRTAIDQGQVGPDDLPASGVATA